MDPDTREAITRVRRSRTAKRIVVAGLTIVTYSYVMKKAGYNMVKPVQFGPNGEVFFKTVMGNICQPKFN